ncbi:TPA: hypothetical protein ACGW44_005432 [Bacillus toyonensis]
MKKQYDETFKNQCVELVIKEGRTKYMFFIRKHEKEKTPIRE